MTLPPGVEVAWREVPAGSPRRDASRALLAELLPGATVSSRCAACGGDHGRPRVEGTDAGVSVSYAPGWAVVAVTWNHTRIGVDAVPAGAAGLERILPHGGGDAIGWARVEAVLKADGRGLAVDPARVEVRGQGPAWTARIRHAAGDGGVARKPRDWNGVDIEAPAGLVAAIVVR